MLVSRKDGGMAVTTESARCSAVMNAVGTYRNSYWYKWLTEIVLHSLSALKQGGGLSLVLFLGLRSASPLGSQELQHEGFITSLLAQGGGKRQPSWPGSRFSLFLGAVSCPHSTAAAD